MVTALNEDKLARTPTSLRRAVFWEHLRAAC